MYGTDYITYRSFLNISTYSCLFEIYLSIIRRNYIDIIIPHLIKAVGILIRVYPTPGEYPPPTPELTPESTPRPEQTPHPRPTPGTPSEASCWGIVLCLSARVKITIPIVPPVQIKYVSVLL